MDRGAWWATVHGVAKSQTRLSDFTFTFMTRYVYMCAIEGMTLERWQLGCSLLFVLWEIMCHLLMTRDFFVSATTM